MAGRGDGDLLRALEDPNLVVSLSDGELRRLAELRRFRGDLTSAPRKDLVSFLLTAGGGQQQQQQQQQLKRPVGRADASRRKALLIGINYRRTSQELGGCITDTRYMNYCLTQRFGFHAQEEVLMLNEDQKNPFQQPTRANVYRAMEWLMTGVRAGDSLVFMYSGHGGQVRDFTGEEVDGMCETILPLDHSTAGPILDKDLYLWMVKPLPAGARLFALCDSCHSGTILDLPYAFAPPSGNTQGGGGWPQSPWRPAANFFKGTSGGDAVCISGCRDDQTSADTKALSGSATTGAMLYAFVKAVEHGTARTYGELIISMRNIIEQALRHGMDWGALASAGVSTMIFGPVVGMAMAGPRLATSFMGGNVQVPQLSSDKAFDLRKPFSL